MGVGYVPLPTAGGAGEGRPSPENLFILGLKLRILVRSPAPIYRVFVSAV